MLEHLPPRGVETYRVSSGMVDRAEGCQLHFRNVHYTVGSKNEYGNTHAELLKGITGRALPGEMMALMGASGAGKTTLLDLLAQRKTVGTIAGDILYNGSPYMRSYAYVMQDNVHMGILTVQESLYYAAELRLNQSMSREAKSKRVQKIIDMLGLREVADVTLGTEDIRGVSGGQLKRVSIGVEIVHLPNLMFLDEPTTGLDSSISLEVMSAVRNLANQNRTIVCTIHQPSEDTFQLFDTLLLLAEGRVVYFGPVTSSVEYFTSSPYEFACKEGANPADFVVTVAGSFVPALDGRHIAGGELAAYYKTTDIHLAAESMQTLSKQEVDELSNARMTTNPLLQNVNRDDSLDHDGPERTTMWFQIKTLLRRRYLCTKKDFVPRFGGPVLRDTAVGLFYGSVFWALDSGSSCIDSTCYTNRTSLIFFSMMLVVMGQLDELSFLLNDRLVFYRERAVKAYGAFPYVLSILIPSMLRAICSNPTYAAIMYPMTALRAGSMHWVAFYLLLLLCNLVVCGALFTCAAIAQNILVALVYACIFILFNIMYSGYVSYIPSMPVWQKWITNLTMSRFVIQGMVLNEFQDNHDLPKYQDTINQLGFQHVSIAGCFAILLLMSAIFSGTMYLGFKYANFEQR